MEELKFRTLTADEIECRVAQVGKSNKGFWCSLLLYKDARCDQRLLDEVVGCFRWKREHELINGNLFCTVSIKDDSGEWVSKQDVGTESNTEKEKGQASDAFKRACFNWGLGRELYTSPKIFVTLSDKEVYEDKGKYKVSPRVSFKVEDISYDNKRNVKTLRIIDSDGTIRFTFDGTKPKAKQASSVSKQPEVKEEPSNITLDDVQKEINDAATAEGLVKIFNKYVSFQQNADFIGLLTKRKEEILGKNGNTKA